MGFGFAVLHTEKGTLLIYAFILQTCAPGKQMYSVEMRTLERTEEKTRKNVTPSAVIKIVLFRKVTNLWKQ